MPCQCACWLQDEGNRSGGSINRKWTPPRPRTAFASDDIGAAEHATELATHAEERRQVLALCVLVGGLYSCGVFGSERLATCAGVLRHMITSLPKCVAAVASSQAHTKRCPFRCCLLVRADSKRLTRTVSLCRGVVWPVCSDAAPAEALRYMLHTSSKRGFSKRIGTEITKLRALVEGGERLCPAAREAVRRLLLQHAAGWPEEEQPGEEQQQEQQQQQQQHTIGVKLSMKPRL